MISFDDYTSGNKIWHNLKWPYIADHPYRILSVGGSGLGKTNVSLNLINNQCQYLINKRGMQNVYKNIEEYNLGKKCKVLIIFDDMIVFLINNK